MKNKRYILTLVLTERDVTERTLPRPLVTTMFYRTTSEGHARIMYDQAISLLRHDHIDLDHDPISQGEEQ